MKIFSILIIFIVVNGLMLVSRTAIAAAPEGQAPIFELIGTEGPVNLANYRGKLVYLDFWASWCGPCRQSFPWMNAMQLKYGGQGFQVIGINLDIKSEDGRSFLYTTPAQFIVAFDPIGITPRKYLVRGMPTSILIGRDGRILSEHIGFSNRDRAELERTIQTALELRN